jgi:hypothetical protein
MGTHLHLSTLAALLLFFTYLACPVGRNIKFQAGSEPESTNHWPTKAIPVAGFILKMGERGIKLF